MSIQEAADTLKAFSKRLDDARERCAAAAKESKAANEEYQHAWNAYEVASHNLVRAAIGLPPITKDDAKDKCTLTATASFTSTKPCSSTRR